MGISEVEGSLVGDVVGEMEGWWGGEGRGVVVDGG